MSKATQEEKDQLIKYLHERDIEDKRIVKSIEDQIYSNNLTSAHLGIIKTSVINALKNFEETGQPPRAPYFIRRVAEDKGLEIIAECLEEN